MIHRLLILTITLSACLAEEKPKTDTITEVEVLQLRLLQERDRSARQSIALAQQAIKDAQGELREIARESEARMKRHCDAAGIDVKVCSIDLIERKVKKEEAK